MRFRVTFDVEVPLAVSKTLSAEQRDSLPQTIAAAVEVSLNRMNSLQSIPAPNSSSFLARCPVDVTAVVTAEQSSTPEQDIAAVLDEISPNGMLRLRWHRIHYEPVSGVDRELLLTFLREAGLSTAFPRLRCHDYDKVLEVAGKAGYGIATEGEPEGELE